MPTKTINDLTATADILDADELAFWNLANSRTDKITYAELKTDLFGGLSGDTEILFNNSGNIDGDSNLTYNIATNVMTLGGELVVTSDGTVTEPIIKLGTEADGFFRSAVNEISLSLNNAQEYIFATSAFTFASDTNATTILGRAKFGSYISDFMFLSHFDKGTTTNYAVKQNQLGGSAFNSQLGQTVTLRTGDATRLTIADALITSAVNLNIIDTTDTTFSTSKLLTRDTGGVVNTIVASGGGTANFLRADGTWAAAGGTISGTIDDDEIAVGGAVTDDIEGDLNFKWLNTLDQVQITGSDHATDTGYLVLNSSITTGGARIFAGVSNATTTGDAFIEVAVNGVNHYAFGLDNSDSDILKITHDTAGVSPSTGTTIMSFGTGAAIGFFGVAPVAQPAHIVDADGSLADITTKFNTLLAQMATLGLQASS